MNKNEKKKEKKQFIGYPLGPVGIASGLEKLGLKGKKLWIVTFLIIILLIFLGFLSAVYKF